MLIGFVQGHEELKWGIRKLNPLCNGPLAPLWDPGGPQEVPIEAVPQRAPGPQMSISWYWGRPLDVDYGAK